MTASTLAQASINAIQRSMRHYHHHLVHSFQAASSRRAGSVERLQLGVHGLHHLAVGLGQQRRQRVLRRQLAALALSDEIDHAIGTLGERVNTFLQCGIVDMGGELAQTIGLRLGLGHGGLIFRVEEVLVELVCLRLVIGDQFPHHLTR